jgi:hypothetical protein
MIQQQQIYVIHIDIYSSYIFRYTNNLRFFMGYYVFNYTISTTFVTKLSSNNHIQL